MLNGKSAPQGQGSEEQKNKDALSGRDVGALAARAAIEKKAEDLALIDLGGRSAVADYFLLLSGVNERQISAIGDAIVRCFKKNKIKILGVEGGDSSHWMLIDTGEVVVHIFHEDVRAFYDIDGLWSDAPRIDIPQAQTKAGSDL